MKFTKAQSSNYYLQDTQVSNIFLKEVMPQAPADYVKIYLYALMQYEAGQYITNESIAAELDIDSEDILKAWSWFEQRRVIRKIGATPNNPFSYDVEFVDLKERLFGVESDTSAGKRAPSALDDNRIQELFAEIEKLTGRMIPGPEYKKVEEILDSGADPELISFAYSYAAERGKDLNARYVGGIIGNWLDKGITTLSQAKEAVSEYDQRYSDYRKIFKAIGKRAELIADSEKRILDSWLDDYELSMDQILSHAEKAAGKQNKFDYLKKIIENEYAKAHRGDLPEDEKAAGMDRFRDRKFFYEKRRRKSEKDAADRRAEVYNKLPEVAKLDESIRHLNARYVSANLKKNSGGRKLADKTLIEINEKVSVKTALMSDSGYPENYMELQWFCQKCRDTGVLDSGANCDCFMSEPQDDVPV